MFLDHSLRLLNRESGEGEHTDLVGNVVPGSLSSDLFKVLSKELSHLTNSIGDVNEFVKPLLSQGGVVQDEGSNSSTVGWWG